MRTWMQIFQIIADMQPGDIDKLSTEEADLIREVVDAIESGETMCFDSAKHEAVSKALDKLAPTEH